MDFEELLEMLRNPGEDGLPETIYDDLGASYNARVSAGDAKVSELTAALEGATTELDRVKAHNYDLLTAVETGNPSDATVTNGDVEEEDEDAVSFDDLITYE